MRFYRYVFVSLGAGLQSRGQGSTFVELSSGALAAIPIPSPDYGRQRKIADFLDIETGRIDGLITKKRRMIDLIAEHRASAAAALVQSERHAPLRRIAGILPGYMFSSADFGPDRDGPVLLRGINVSVGGVRWDDTVRLRADFIVPDRYRLVEGDLVIGMDRPFIGRGTRVARIDSRSAGAFLVQRVCRVRSCSPNMAIVIEHVLRSQRFVAHVSPDLTGVSVPHLSDEQIGSMPVPVFDGAELRTIGSRLTAVTKWSACLTHQIERQIALLQEHRQALITAAVAGEIDIRGEAA